MPCRVIIPLGPLHPTTRVKHHIASRWSHTPCLAQQTFPGGRIQHQSGFIYTLLTFFFFFLQFKGRKKNDRKKASTRCSYEDNRGEVRKERSISEREYRYVTLMTPTFISSRYGLLRFVKREISQTTSKVNKLNLEMTQTHTTTAMASPT